MNTTTKKAALLTLCGGVALAASLTGCSGPAEGAGTTDQPNSAESGTAETTRTSRTTQSEGAQAADELGHVLFLGDSIAVGQALPLGQALGVADVEFTSLASAGGGAVVGPVAERVWKELPGQIADARPSAVVYQLNSYDRGTKKKQTEAYERLLEVVTSAGADLFFVTMPPLKPDDFYAPHMDAIERTAQVAQEVVEGADGNAYFLDASAVWGEEYQRTIDGRIYRSSDGIHTCPQGAAQFTHWLLGELAEVYAGFKPPAPQVWANTGWSGNDVFHGC